MAASAVLVWAAGPPPGNGEGILRWAAEERLWLALADEASLVGAATLVAGLSPLRTSFRTGWAAGLLAVGVPLGMTVDVVFGRLVYPVFDLSLTEPASAELVVAVVWGGRHAVWLLRAGAAFLSATGPGRAAAAAGGLGAALAAFPWLVPADAVLLAELAWVGWLGTVGWRLARE